jgi:hypothetical protein
MSAIQGHIQDGMVVLDTPTPLPDGTAVRVEPIEASSHFMNEAEVTAYVEQLRDEVAAARFVRIAWMRRQGLDAEEIEESLRDEPPTNVAEEMKQIRALDHLDLISVPGQVLDRIAAQY